MTRLLRAWQAGDPEAEDDLWPLVYGELRTLAASAIGRRGSGLTLETTELVNEACVRLLGEADLSWPDRAHFFAFAAQVMRNVLVDHARRRRAGKRRGEIVDEPIDRIAEPGSDRAADVVAIDEALSRLEEIRPRLARLVELRFFGGLSIDEAAAVLEISRATAIRDWQTAKAWLYGELKGR